MKSSRSEAQAATVWGRKGVRWGLLLLCAAAVQGIYLATSAATHSAGYPLDDAWIHQTFARSLAQRGEWAFLPGTVSGGSTSPLWTMLLVPGQFVSGAAWVWTQILGGLCLFLTGWMGQRWYDRLVQADGGGRGGVPWVGLFLILEWHLSWAAGSGMETLLYAGLILAVFAGLTRAEPKWAWLGAAAGVGVWIRPDALTLLGPVGLVLLGMGGSGSTTLKRMLAVGTGFGAVFALYLGFNLLTAGSIWPNTFYAKQAEYASLLAQPYAGRLLQMAAMPWVGAGLLLLPGAVYALGGWKRRQWVVLAGLIWWLGYTGLYAWRLPVVYQHARYLIPAMPVIWTVGFWGMRALAKRMATAFAKFSLVRFAWGTLTAGVLLGFVVLGARSYAEDVAIIETEMVDTAVWIRANTEVDALIAVHDIGAVGYFGERRIVDLAGLVTPELIPFLRDEERLCTYLDDQQVDYLVVFPNWYESLENGKEVVYRSPGIYAPRAGGENMTVYRWR